MAKFYAYTILHRQAAVQKRKRQERDALFKKQAEERKQADEAKKAKEAAAAPLADEDSDDDVDAQNVDRNGREFTTGKKRANKMSIPDLLPDEYLTDPSSDEEENDTASATERKPKRRRVAVVERNLTRLDRGPRDEQLGSTLYRVTKKTDDRLAPKLSKHAKSSKDVLLKRNRTAVKPRGGFFKR